MTTPYHIKISPIADQAWQGFNTKQQKTMLKLIETLAINPRPPGARKIDGMTGLYCQPIGQSRIIYKIEDQEVLILLIK